MSVIIKVENIGKLYKLGEVGTGALAHDISRWWARVRGKEDPFAKIAQTNDRTKKSNNDYVWALKNVSFDVQAGEILGIIGRNGAGKSTLLKILSKVTKQTEGSIKLKGKIASLLEVGTGFHPELTGRENVFLNGAILGMTKAEIKARFDEIVNFAGVERYIDTPVKRYSSGMYVRLAFAVAAHLEPEILIIDEVLAVGDLEFQKKCLNKMKDVSENHGRTVLFVSHDLNAIKSLTTRCILMNQGTVGYIGTPDDVVRKYLDRYDDTEAEFKNVDKSKPNISSVSLTTSKEGGIQYFGYEMTLTARVNIPEPTDALEMSYELVKTDTNEPIAYNFFSTSGTMSDLKGKSGSFDVNIKIPSLRLYRGEYYVKFNLSDPRGKVVFQRIEKSLPFEVFMYDIFNEWGFADGICKYIEESTLEISKQ